MGRLIFVKKQLLLLILLLSIFDAADLRAGNNVLQKQAISQPESIVLSAKDVELITARSDIDFAYIPKEMVEVFLFVEPFIAEKQINTSAHDLYYYLHNDYKVAPEAVIKDILLICPDILESKKK